MSAVKTDWRKQNASLCFWVEPILSVTTAQVLVQSSCKFISAFTIATKLAFWCLFGWGQWGYSPRAILVSFAICGPTELKCFAHPPLSPVEIYPQKISVRDKKGFILISTVLAPSTWKVMHAFMVAQRGAFSFVKKNCDDSPPPQTIFVTFTIFVRLSLKFAYTYSVIVCWKLISKINLQKLGRSPGATGLFTFVFICHLFDAIELIICTCILGGA